MRRLTAEEVRDSILSVAGTLNLKAGGPPVHPPIPREVMAGQSVPGQGWPVSSAVESARRSVFVHVKRSLLVPILATHDAADTDLSCPVRYTTTVPTQALGFLNGAFANEQAARFAERLTREAPDGLESQVRLALNLTTARKPDEREVERDVAFVKRITSDGRLGHARAISQYCLDDPECERLPLPRLKSNRAELPTIERHAGSLQAPRDAPSGPAGTFAAEIRITAVLWCECAGTAHAASRPPFVFV